MMTDEIERLKNQNNALQEHNRRLVKELQKIVRCKDCRHKVVTKDGEWNPEDIVCDYWMSDGLDSEDFCSYGERKEERRCGVMVLDEYLTEHITLCDINDDCTECPRYGDDCDGRTDEDG